MTFCGGFGYRHQRWSAGKGPLFASQPPPDFQMAWFCSWCLFTVFRGTMPSGSHLTIAGAFHRLVADAGANRLTFQGTGEADQGLRRMGLVCLKQSISTVARVEVIEHESSHFSSIIYLLIWTIWGSKNVYIPSKVGRKSGRKYGFIRFGEFYHDKSAIEVLNGETMNGHKLEVAWAKFQKRSASRPRKQREEPQKKMQQVRNPNGDLEVVGNDVHDGLSDNSKTITQPLDNAHNRHIFVKKFPSQAPSCGSSIKDDEKINSTSLRPFDHTLEMDIQLHEKREMAKYSNKGKKSDNKNSRPIHNSPPQLK
ncbi:hypothetical protein Cgig2_010600 [Carnegiea gigantea]|uniref:RRM domain-containing protein n=1 Tax=Carnegiea gigantea TaxID=171969 RepID=A0A9Q1KTP8_9CARY|nr:hypothetical protein Cgig2_010600 [Carnegiea gigantea]